MQSLICILTKDKQLFILKFTTLRNSKKTF